MHAVLTLALGILLADASNQPQWMSDYGTALEYTQLEGKPLLIVIDDSKSAGGRIEQVSHSDQSQAALLANYTLCHVDASTPYGQKVVEAFKAAEVPFTAIIDKSGKKQIFRQAGAFTAEQWQATLTTHREGNIPARPVSSSSFGSYSRMGGCSTCR